MMRLFAPFRFDMLSSPWALSLLAAVALLFLAELFARAPGAMTISTGEALADLRGYTRDAFRRLPVLLRVAGLALLVIALAGPKNGFQVRKDRADVIDIMLCVDLSGSMRQADFRAGGQLVDRLFVTKEAVRDFIESRKERAHDRFGLDRVGLVLYAAFAWTGCPLTLDYGILEHELDAADIDPNDPRSNSTAIGSAIGLAVRRLSQSEARSKVIILLTDGLNNAGELSPMTAAKLAREYGIRVYTIGAGSTEPAHAGGFGIFSRRTQPIDEKALKAIAEETGGKYYRATDLDTLQGAYAEINELERTEIEGNDYYEYKEAFVPYALLGGLLLLASILSRRIWFEPIP